MLPLLALQALSLLKSKREAEAAVYRSLAASAGDAAANLDNVFNRAEQLLAFFASREEIKSLDVARCKVLLSDVKEMGKTYANVLLVSASGELVCSSEAGPAPSTFVEVPWFRPGLGAPGSRLSSPLVGKITGRHVSVLTLPVRHRSGEVVGLLAAAIDLELLSQSLSRGDLPPEGTVSATNGEDLFLARSPNPATWIGKRISDDARNKRLNTPASVIVAIGVDGTERAFSAVGLPKWGLRVSAGMPVALLSARVREDMTESILITLLVACMGIAAALVASRKLAVPLESIAETTRRLAQGESGVRADRALPGEFGEVAVEFNRLMDKQEEGTEKLRLSERRALRVSSFYEALSSTNQAIVRSPEPAVLYDEVCEICARSKLADMAWIGIVDGSSMRPVAWGGRGREYAEDINIDLGTGIASGGPSAMAVRLGRPVTVNDYLNEPSIAPWRERAARFNVRASAAFPFTTNGQVVGTLNLYVGEEDYFDEELVALLEAMMHDISFALDSHKQQMARAAAEQALATRELQMSGIIEAVADPIVTIDEDGRIVLFNEAAGELFGVDSKAALGRPIAHYVPQGLGNGLEQTWSAQLSGCREDGSVCSLRAQVSTHSYPQGKLTTAVLRDETKLQQAERSRAALLEAEAANRAKTTFLSKVSHELRTPLNAILGFTQLLQLSARDSLSKPEREQLDHVFMAGTQLRELIDDVMDVSMIEAGNLSLNVKEVELLGLLEGVLKMSEPLAAKTGVSLVADFSAQAPLRLTTDPVRLRQVLLNLMSNAIKYNKPGGNVQLCARYTDERLCLRVVDNGLGMSSVQQASLFQPFNRVGRESSSIEGTGIGLNLTRQLVDLLGGTLQVRSKEGVGTEMTVVLPAPEARPSLAAHAPGAVETFAPTRATDLSHGVVLYIEDNPVNALLLEQLLLPLSQVQVVVASTGAQGVSLATQLRPDLVLLDMQLPDMSGLDVLARLRGSPTTSDLRVIALSASAMPDEVEAARRAGAEDYWTKPIDFVQVLRGVSEMLKA